MKLFQCQNCSQLLHFENRECENCGYRLGYLPRRAVLTALTPSGDDWTPLADSENSYRFCKNAAFDVCNWLIPSGDSETLCLACRHNRTIPDLSDGENLLRWRRIEFAQHHLFYTLGRLNLPLFTRQEHPETGLAFDFLADGPLVPGGRVMTGHDNGIITLNLSEADSSAREQLRQAMGEPYRTLLGHFRHEIGHYYWDRLLADTGRLDDFRALFGDERPDYDNALQNYYANGPAPQWQQRYVSAYASAHPWEDFAETWAHYLHIVDTLEMARAYGLAINPSLESAAPSTPGHFDPYAEGDISALIDAWLPITLAVNSLNRCMGQPDLYPFVLSAAVIEKLGFIHDLIHRQVPAEGAAMLSAAD